MKKNSTLTQGRDCIYGIPILSIFLLVLFGASLQFQTYAHTGIPAAEPIISDLVKGGYLPAVKSDCLIAGPDTLCPLGTAQYSAPDTMVSYAWSVSGSGVILGDPTLQVVEVQGNGGCDTSFTLNLTVVGSAGLLSSCDYNVRLVDVTPPEISNVPGMLLLNCPSEVPLATVEAVKVMDNCDGNVVVSVADSIINFSCDNQFDVIRTWTAEDVCGNLSTASQYIMVFDSIGPVFTDVPDSLWLECTSEIPNASLESMKVVDGCDGYIVLSVVDSIFNFECMNQFNMIRTWTAEDMCGNTSTALQYITVFDDTPPEIHGIPADTVICCEDSIPNLSSVTASDNCSVTELVSFTKMVIDSLSPRDYTLKMIWVYSDQCDNVASDSMIIEVNNPHFKEGKNLADLDSKERILSRFTVAPNPFKQKTTISFVPALDGFYELDLYSFLGVRVRSLHNGSEGVGEEVIIPLKSDELMQGIYFLVLKSEYGTETMKIVVSK
jgi:hypothetical protein